MQDVQMSGPETESSNDYHRLPASEKQLRFARWISSSAGVILPRDVQQDRNDLSRWIDRHRSKLNAGRFSNYPTSKQVGFAERIARIKRREIPHECFRDKMMMSRWIDANR